MIQRLGRQGINVISEFGGIALFGVTSISAIVSQRHIREKISRSIYEIGVRCVPITLIVGLFMGLVLGLNLFYVLAKFSSEAVLGQVVALAVIQQIGPVFTAIMIVAQAGSALSAEIGIQRNAEQIDALQTMRINPKGFLVSPRLFAAILCFPILTALFNLVGIIGGHITGVELLGVDHGSYWNRIYEGVAFIDVMHSMLKALIFGVLTTIIFTYQGFFTNLISSVPGARGVSQTTTRAVVICCISILACNYVLTSFMLAK
ncbi:MAG: ABC transporter permease [Verrucomicrobiota bacterium]